MNVKEWKKKIKNKTYTIVEADEIINEIYEDYEKGNVTVFEILELIEMIKEIIK